MDCLDGSAVQPVCVIARPSVVRRQSELPRRNLCVKLERMTIFSQALFVTACVFSHVVAR